VPWLAELGLMTICLTRVLVTSSLVTRVLVKGGVVHQHPVVRQSLVRDRVAELRHSAEASTPMRGEERWHRLVAAGRRGTGWLLIDMGLRLAMPRGGTNHRVARGQ
jgi:hypothetical protein